MPSLPSEPPPADPALSPRMAWALACGIALLAVGLRLWDINAQSLWLDELWTLELSTGRGSLHLAPPVDQVLDPAPAITQYDGAPAPWHIWHTLRTVTHPPLYFLALRLWCEVAGAGDLAARLFSVLCSAIAVLVLFDTARRHVGARSALWAALLMALAQPMVEYGQSVRNYAFLVAIALAAANILTRIEQHGPTLLRLSLLTLALLATALTHYFAAGTLLAFFIYVAIQFKGRDRIRTAAAFVLAGFLFLLAWGPFMYEQRAVFATTDPTTQFLQATRSSPEARIQQAIALPLRFLMEPPPEFYPWACIGFAAWILPFLLWRRPETRLYSLWFAATITLIALMDLARSTLHLSHIRYTLLAAPGLYVLLAAAFRHRDGMTSILLPAIAATLCVLGLLTREQTNPNWRALATAVDQSASPRDLVVYTVRPDQPDWVLGYMHMAMTHYSNHPQRPAILLRNPSPVLSSQWKRYPKVWLVSNDPTRAPEAIAPGFQAVNAPSGGQPPNVIAIYELVPTP